jgi:hypothetical protein
VASYAVNHQLKGSNSKFGGTPDTFFGHLSVPRLGNTALSGALLHLRDQIMNNDLEIHLIQHRVNKKLLNFLRSNIFYRMPLNVIKLKKIWYISGMHNSNLMAGQKNLFTC